jgi:hypothetical protein
MTRPDLYDYVGMAVAALILALWVAHFVLPSPRPDNSRLPAPSLQALPATPSR